MPNCQEEFIEDQRRKSQEYKEREQIHSAEDLLRKVSKLINGLARQNEFLGVFQSQTTAMRELQDEIERFLRWNSST